MCVCVCAYIIIKHTKIIYIQGSYGKTKGRRFIKKKKKEK